ncbi:cell cycle checkpoint protein RAD17 [Culicoides brevitarsis]|uniref:cell cycle checkpoint protein RAD17 n=1 Tax=Culicoides brevitarsis TaxID=469753 RepID=UPI00307C7046
MSKRPMKWLKPLTFIANESNDTQNRSQGASKSSFTTFRRSFSDSAANTIDLTFDDDEIPFKKAKLDVISQKDIIQQITPKSSEDLVIHAKKLEEVKGWFNEVARLQNIRKNPILLVTGPCGSGKLSAVKIIAQENGFDVHEYVVPLDIEVPENENQEVGEIRKYGTKQGQMESLMKFLRQTSRFGTIFNKAKEKKLIVCKDIPNVFCDEPEMFQQVLEDYSKTGRSPLVFITNDSNSKKLNLNYKLFNDETMQKFKIAQITFNPVSYMQINKHLKAVASKMSKFRDSFNTPTNEMIESVIVSSQGDLRNATINLLFACQKGAVNMGMEMEPSKLTEKKKAKKYKGLGTDENITMMHLLGKVFNPKYETKDNQLTLTNDPEYLTDLFSTQANTCTKMIFVNYIERFTKMEDIASALDLLSLSDVMMNDWRDDTLSLLGLNIAIRGTMVTNTEPVTGYKGKIKGFKNTFVTKNDAKSEKSKKNPNSDAYGMNATHKTWTSEDLPKATFICDCSTFAKIIKSHRNESLLDLDISVFDDEMNQIEDFSDDDVDLL